MATLLPTDVFHLLDGPVSLLVEWSMYLVETHQFYCWVPLEGLAPPPNAIRVLAVELVSLKTGNVVEVACGLPLLGFLWFHTTKVYIFLHEAVVLNLE